jgi:molybdopterin synthase catalytic subunit
MVVNESASFLLEWIKDISIVFTAVGAVSWPFCGYLKNKSNNEYKLKILEYERQEKKDKEVIQSIVQTAFDQNLAELKQTYMEVVGYLKRGELK